MTACNKDMEGRIIICLPQKPNIDTAVISKIQCQLRVIQDPIILHVHSAMEFLNYSKASIVDDNGDIVTLLDTDLNWKMVVSERDLNLYFALRNEGMLEKACVETVPFSSRYRK